MNVRPTSSLVADVVRQVNARHARLGSPELPELTSAWLIYRKVAYLAELAGDESVATRALNEYKAAAHDAMDAEEVRRTERRQ